MSRARIISTPSMMIRPSITCGCGPWPWRGRTPSCDGPPNQSRPIGAFTIESLPTRVFEASACSWVQFAEPGSGPSRLTTTRSPLRFTWACGVFAAHASSRVSEGTSLAERTSLPPNGRKLWNAWRRKSSSRRTPADLRSFAKMTLQKYGGNCAKRGSPCRMEMSRAVHVGDDMFAAAGENLVGIRFESDDVQFALPERFRRRGRRCRSPRRRHSLRGRRRRRAAAACGEGVIGILRRRKCGPQRIMSRRLVARPEAIRSGLRAWPRKAGPRRQRGGRLARPLWLAKRGQTTWRWGRNRRRSENRSPPP